MTPREQIELALAGCVLEQPDLVAELRLEWFWHPLVVEMLAKVAQMSVAGQPVTFATLLHESHNPEFFKFLNAAQDQCFSPANFPYWRDQIMDLARRDRLAKAAQKFLTQLPASNGSLGNLIAELENTLAEPVHNQRQTFGPKDCATELAGHLEARFNLQGRHSGLETGFSFLDYMTDGLQFGEVTVLAARPSVGKTAIACNVVNRVCLKEKIPTLVLSLEMSAPALCRRMLSDHESIPMQNLKSGRIDERDFSKIPMFDTLVRNSPLYIREGFGGMSAGEAAALIRRMANRNGVKFVVLDYLQKLKSDSRHEKRTYEVAEASGAMVEAVRQTGVAFLCLAQLNRESEREKGRIPRISDLADSGQIERDADTVLLLHRNRAEPTAAKLIVGKQRDGETGLVELHFNGEFCRFQNVTCQPEKI